MGWKIVELSDATSIKLYLDNLLIYRNEIRYLMPLKDIDTLIIDNTKISISVQLLNKFGEYNINVITCNNKHLPSSQIIPLSGNYNSLKVINKQVNWTEEWKGQTWSKIIYQKIKNQSLLLKYFNFDNIELEKLKKQIEFYDNTNREGHASKIYWHTMYGVRFSRDDDSNQINALLNYGYAILLSFVSRSIVKKGLDLRIALFHKSYNNCYALACDLMEPFRPIVDSFIFKLTKTNKNVFLMAFKEDIIQIFTKKIKINNQWEYINNAIDVFVEWIVAGNDIPEVEIDYDQF